MIFELVYILGLVSFGLSSFAQGYPWKEGMLVSLLWPIAVPLLVFARFRG